MRIQISIDSASEPQMRALARALAENDLSLRHGEGLTIGLDGPEKYSAETPKMPMNQGAMVLDDFATTIRGFLMENMNRVIIDRKGE